MPRLLAALTACDVSSGVPYLGAATAEKAVWAMLAADAGDSCADVRRCAFDLVFFVHFCEV
jgi:hypothetical protein